MLKDLLTVLMIVAVGCGTAFVAGCRADGSGGLGVGAAPVRRIAVEDYVDKMKAGWIGQMAGVGWGGPTEFRYKGEIIPEDKMPVWKPELINQFRQDDIYVEMTFLRTLELYGMDDDIDYQIEADYAGLIAPGMPNVAIELGETFGRLMNYGDGLYGGQFVGGMYAEAFFENDMEKIVRAGLKCIPQGSQYAECIRDVLAWYKQYPDDWQKTWELIEAKYQDNPAYRRFSCNKDQENMDFNIDAKINGAYIVMGLLYGKGDPDQTIIISTRCGQDSDCNPSNSGGVLFTTIGFKSLPEKFTSALNPEGKFSHTPYNFPMLVEVSKKLVRQSVVRAGGRVETDAEGREVFVIPIREPKPGKLEQCWEPGPIANSKFTEAEIAKITAIAGEDISEDVSKFAPGWKVTSCGPEMDPGLHEQAMGKSNVLVTHPLDRRTGCQLSRELKLPADKETVLRLTVGHHPEGDWALIVAVNGKQMVRKVVGKETAPDGWMETKVDLSEFAGEKVKLELINHPTGWAFEAGYWAEIALVSL